MALGSFPSSPASDHGIPPWLSNQVGIPVVKVASLGGPTYASWFFSPLPTCSWPISRFFLQGVIHDKIIKIRTLTLA